MSEPGCDPRLDGRPGEGSAGEDDERGGATPASVRLGTYLRRLREGYGYTLRKVEEQSLLFGEPIDNSQLSRFEKGKAIPSFEKLRALARIFSVSVQNFSDILDLEEFEKLKPTSSDYDDLIRAGAAHFSSGEHGRAFVTFERALEVVEQRPGGGPFDDAAMEVRWRMAAALKALGKLSMTEQELREILKRRHSLSPRTRMRTLLQLGYVYREMGDLYLSSVLARECLEIAVTERDVEAQAGVLNTLGNIFHDEGDFAAAAGHYRRALEVLDLLATREELRTTVLTNLGGCLVATGHYAEGVAKIREAHGKAIERGYRRVAALALTRLGEAQLQHGDSEAARASFAESDSLASRSDEAYHDILFLNAFRRWEIARREGNDTREKIAFGRLRHLRSFLERRFPEVDEFDRIVETVRRKHAHTA